MEHSIKNLRLQATAALHTMRVRARPLTRRLAAAAVVGACLGGGPTLAIAADIAATAGSLNNHVWSRFTPAPTTLLSTSNGAQVATGVFSQASNGTVLPLPLVPAFTVSNLSVPALGAFNAIGTYAPGSGPVPGTGYPAASVHQNEFGSSTSALNMQMRYQFAAALPTGTIVWLQDVDFAEIATVRFADCTNGVVNPSAFDAYLFTGNLPSRTFSAADVTLVGVAPSVGEPTIGIVIRSPNVCRVDVSLTTITTSTIQVYFSIPAPRVTLVKALQSAGRVANTDQFAMQIRDAGGAIANLTANSTTTGTGAAVTAGSGTTGVTSVVLNAPYTLTEAAAGTTALARYASAIACTNANAGSATALPTGAGQSFTVTPSSAQDDITCTLTNTRLPSLVLRKALPGGRLLAADQFVLNIAGAISGTATTTGATTAPTQTATVNATASGTAFTLSELGAGATSLSNYTTSYACSNTAPGGQTPSGSGTSFAVTTGVGDALDCTFTNVLRPQADLSVVKTSTPASVLAGGLVNYTLTLGNAGPSAADGAVVRDTPGAGLDCTEAGLAAPTCSATGPATCPGAVTAAGLISGAGLTIPTFGVGGGLTIVLQCRVTANGV